MWCDQGEARIAGRRPPRPVCVEREVMSQSGYQQPKLEIQSKRVYEVLHSALERVLASEAAGRFLRKLENRGLKARSVDAVLAAKVLEQLDDQLAGSGKTASQWYAELPVPDQGQLREFYLTAVEAVDPGLREKYAKIYRNY